MRHTRFHSTLLAAVSAVLLLVGSAAAITGGQLDGEGHPAVGALVADIPGVGRVPLCSGTLVAPTVFLTAGHCTADLPAVGVDRVLVSFSAALGASNALIGATYITDPAYGHDRGDLHDLSVVLLDDPPVGITPAALPTAGLLDELHRGGALRGQLFTNVGYGYSGRETGSGHPRFLYDGQRRVSTSSFSSLTKSSLKLQGNGNATGLGGVCFGDSGGPAFLGESDTIAAITSSGSQTCSGASVSYRLDTPSARQFLDQFVALP
ncbi:trypsin-like serine protease [Gaiella sp.]|uniref:trypsin-like serine protease n=1 Tax=Gaiella sp. TaxID=2663207 RepID=UPI0032642A7F